jgi:hypothetical protein
MADFTELKDLKVDEIYLLPQEQAEDITFKNERIVKEFLNDNKTPNPSAGQKYWLYSFRGVNFTVTDAKFKTANELDDVFSVQLICSEYISTKAGPNKGELVKGFDFDSFKSHQQIRNGAKNKAFTEAIKAPDAFKDVDFIASLDLVSLSESSS